MTIKAFVIVLLVGWTAKLSAQEIPSFTHLADSAFRNLNKGEITTGILYDRVYPNAMLHVFNSSSLDTTNVYHFKQSYFDLYNASYNNAKFLKPETLDERIKQLRVKGQVPIGILNFEFNQIDTNAIESNLLENRGGMLYEVPNRSRSPYLKKSVTVLSPLVDSVVGLQVAYQTSQLLYLQNTGRRISNLRADFNNGSGLISIGLNNVIRINYSSYGRKIIRFVVKYDDNKEITTYAVIKLGREKITAARAVATACDKDDYITASIPFTDYENNTFKGQGNIHYYFSTSTPCNGTVKKPIIILDGFDPGDQRPISQLYDVFLNNEKRYKFGDEMRSRGYDIVVLNFPTYVNESGKTIDGGADYIERNAFVLVQLIDKLNLELKNNGSTEQLVIVGPSMGGMISRYALSWMEKNNIEHNTRLWISLDAPHNGANVPIGAQKYIEFFANNGNKGAQETLQKQLNNAAAKEQLLHHYSSYSVEATGAPGFRDKFALALTSNGLPGSNGFPTKPRKIALVDGSLDGTLQANSLPCQLVLNSKSYLTINLFLFKTQLFRVANASIYFSGGYGNPCTVLSASQLAKTSVTAYGTAPAYSTSYDIAPGGWRNSFTTLADEGQGYSEFFQFLLQLGTTTEFNVYNSSHSFVSTKSALAFNGTNKDLAENIYNRDLVCTGETPFSTYYGPTKNLEHSYIDSAMAIFTIAEITGEQRQPPHATSIPNVYIAGPDRFCEPGGIFSLQGDSVLPAPTLSWSVSPSIAKINSGQSSREVQLDRIDNGTATISLQLNQTCGVSQTLNKTFTIGGYTSTDYPINGPFSARSNQYVYFTTNQLPGASSYHWFWPSDWKHIAGQGTYNILLQTGTSSGIVGVTAASACDAGGSPALKFVGITGSQSFSVNLAPNPASANVNITIGDGRNRRSGYNSNNKIYQLQVVDMLGNVKKKLSYAGDTNIKINLSSLKSGTYFIYVYNGKFWSNQKLVLVH